MMEMFASMAGDIDMVWRYALNIVDVYLFSTNVQHYCCQQTVPQPLGILSLYYSNSSLA